MQRLTLLIKYEQLIRLQLKSVVAAGDYVPPTCQFSVQQPSIRFKKTTVPTAAAAATRKAAPGKRPLKNATQDDSENMTILATMRTQAAVVGNVSSIERRKAVVDPLNERGPLEIYR